jgi:hypothetical protein
LFLNGLPAQTKNIEIGLPDTQEPTFRNISFGLEVDGNLKGTGNVLPSGSRVTARFIHQNMTTGTSWSVLWYYNGELISREDLTWSEVDQQQGTNLATVRLATEGNVPLQPGQYRLELYIDDLLAARGDLVVAGADEGALPTVFSDLRFVSADMVDAAVDAASSNSFADRVASIYTLFDWRSLARGTLWRMRWSVDGVVFYDQISPWLLDFEGENFATRLQSTGAIPDGTYRLELSINNILLVTEEFQIGIGQLPIDPFASAEGVQLNGQIIDAETGEGIPGVTFMLLSADFSVEDFIWDADQIYATAVTDRNGHFQLDRLLQYEDPYSVIVAADGYIQISADGVVVNTETPNPQEIVIPLTRAQ